MLMKNEKNPEKSSKAKEANFILKFKFKIDYSSVEIVDKFFLPKFVKKFYLIKFESCSSKAKIFAEKCSYFGENR